MQKFRRMNHCILWPLVETLFDESLVSYLISRVLDTLSVQSHQALVKAMSSDSGGHSPLSPQKFSSSGHSGYKQKAKSPPFTPKKVKFSKSSPHAKKNFHK